MTMGRVPVLRSCGHWGGEKRRKQAVTGIELEKCHSVAMGKCGFVQRIVSAQGVEGQHSAVCIDGWPCRQVESVPARARGSAEQLQSVCSGEEAMAGFDTGYQDRASVSDVRRQSGTVTGAPGPRCPCRAESASASGFTVGPSTASLCVRFGMSGKVVGWTE